MYMMLTEINELEDMINHFKEGTGKEYKNQTLTKEASEHETTKAYVEFVKNGGLARSLYQPG